MEASEERLPWSLERRAWLLALAITGFSALLMHLSPTAGSFWPKAFGDLLVGLSLVMVIAGGRESGYGERGTLPLAVGVALLAPIVGYAFDPEGVMGRVFGTLEFFVVGMALAGLVIAFNRRSAPRDDSGRPDRSPSDS